MIALGLIDREYVDDQMRGFSERQGSRVYQGEVVLIRADGNGKGKTLNDRKWREHAGIGLILDRSEVKEGAVIFNLGYTIGVESVGLAS
jgi:hypothetical protein